MNSIKKSPSELLDEYRLNYPAFIPPISDGFNFFSPDDVKEAKREYREKRRKDVAHARYTFNIENVKAYVERYKETHGKILAERARMRLVENLSENDRLMKNAARREWHENNKDKENAKNRLYAERHKST